MRAREARVLHRRALDQVAAALEPLDGHRRRAACPRCRASRPRSSTGRPVPRAPPCPSSVSFRGLAPPPATRPRHLRARRRRRRARACSSRSRSWSVALAAMSACSACSRSVEPLERALQPRRPPCAPRAATAPAGAPPERAAARRRRLAGRGGAAQLEVLLDPAGQVAHAAVAEQRVDVVADALDEVAVVADHHERAGPAVEQVLERASACRCRGRWSARRAAARSARPSAAASAAAGGARRRRGRARACGPSRRGSRSARASMPGGRARGRRRASRGRLTASSASSTRRWPGISAVSWESSASLTVAPRSTSPASGSQLAGEQPDQRRLARAVDADERRRGRPGPSRQVASRSTGAPS